MPVLPQPYSAPALDRAVNGGRRATADDFGASGLAAAGEQLTSFAKKLEQDAEDSEVRRSLVATSETRAKYAKLLDEAEKTGADTSQLRQQMLDEISKVGENFVTRKGVDAIRVHTANTTLSFDQEANQINVRRARSDAELQARKFQETEGASVIKNPSYLPQAERNADLFAQSFSNIPPRVREEIARKLKEEFNQAAAWEEMKLFPQETKVKLERGEWNLSPDARRVLIGQSEQQFRQMRADAEHQQNILAKEERGRISAAEDRLMDAVRNGPINWSEIRDDTELNGYKTPEGIEQAKDVKRRLIDWRDLLIRQGRAERRADAAEARANASMARRTDDLAASRVAYDIFNLHLNGVSSDSGPIKDQIMVQWKKNLDNGGVGGFNERQAAALIKLDAEAKGVGWQKLQPRIESTVRAVEMSLRDNYMYKNFPEVRQAIIGDYKKRIMDVSEQFRSGELNGSVNELINPKSQYYIATPQFIQESIENIKRARSSNAQGMAAPASPTMKAGDIIAGEDGMYLFKGGDRKDKKNYEKVKQGAVGKIREAP